MSDTPLSAFATTLDEARGVIDRLERELAEATRQLETTRNERNKIGMRVRSEWMAKAMQADKERDTWRTRCKEAQRVAGLLGDCVMANHRFVLSDVYFAARDAGKDE